MPEARVLAIAGLEVTAPIDKAGMEAACAKLRETGLFTSIAYHYETSEKNGYALTLSLVDDARLVTASIDVPGADESEAWQWLAARFAIADRRVPASGAAQTFLARELERHLGDRTRGQHVTVRMETGLATRAMTFSFQPEVLPRLRSVTFTGNRAVSTKEISTALEPVISNMEYTARTFANALEMNLRPVYEQRGLYRVRFAAGEPEWGAGTVSISVVITEGLPYRLGKIEIVGDGLPVKAMLSAGNFRSGKLANWKIIQDGVWEMEKVVKRAGFMNAVAIVDRIYDDDARIVSLRIRMNKGPEGPRPRF